MFLTTDNWSVLSGIESAFGLLNDISSDVALIKPSFVSPSLNSIVSPAVIIWSKLPVPLLPALTLPLELISPDAVIDPSPIDTSDPIVVILP